MAAQQEKEEKPKKLILTHEILFQGKVFKPKTVTQEELEYLAKFPDEVPFLKIL